MNRQALWAGASSLALTLGAGCAAPHEPAPASFSLVDNVSDIVVTEDIETHASVHGRIQQTVRYRGFTITAEGGEAMELDLQAYGETRGFRTGTIPGRVLVYGPVADPTSDAFDTLVADSHATEDAHVSCSLASAGTYLVAVTATTDTDDSPAQFDLDVDCTNCPEPVEPRADCRAGTLYVEGAVQTTDTWDSCEVVLLEPTTIAADETITIGPDVHVRAHYYITDYHDLGWGEVGIDVDGSLVLQGRPEHEVIFSSNVPSKQWRGIRLNSPDQELGHFKLFDTYEGLTVTERADRAHIHHARFGRNAVAIHLDEAEDVLIESIVVQDNRMGLTNQRGTGRRARGRNSNLRVDGALFSWNDSPIVLRWLQNSELRGLELYNNENGVAITNTNLETPEQGVVITEADIAHNAYGISLDGSGVVDRARILDNDQFGVRTSAGWQKVRNSSIQRNGAGCAARADSYREYYNCAGGVIAQANTRTVIRNNEIANNHGFGAILHGTAGVAPRGGTLVDPAILNSFISNNRDGAFALVDSPVVSIEFNEIGGNGPAEITVAFAGACGASGDPIVVGTCRFSNHRIERNNFSHFTDMFRLDHRTDGVDYSTWVARLWAGRTFNAENNYFDGLTEDLVRPQFEVTPLSLTARTVPEPQAGLVHSLEE